MDARCVAVAYSGGRDSTALLHATAAAAKVYDVRVLALHVHHGLSPNADAWLAHCEAQCRRWSRAGRPIEFFAHRIEGAPAKGDSVEAWARKARYRALREMALAHGAEIVLLAHHQRDQAETLLLQALRGAGVAGLAGMPRSVLRDGISWQRPWLAKPRGEIAAYMRRHRLKHIDDDSNADPRYARNRLRLRVWPALLDAFPQADSSLAASATWAEQASAALDELAALDLAEIAMPQGFAVRPWLALSVARRSNALRAWVKQHQQIDRAPASLITRLMEELPASRAARWPIGAGELRLHRGVLRIEADAASASPMACRETALSIRRAGRHALPGWGGALIVARAREGGVPMAWLAQLELRARAGAEQFQAGIGRPPRSLKKQYQQAGIAAWERDGPLVYSGGQLVYVPGLGLDTRVIGLPGQALASLRWVPTPSAA